MIFALHKDAPLYNIFFAIFATLFCFLLMATGVCNHIYSETYDKDGNKYITCQGEGNTCHIEISVGSGGTISNVYIVTC